MKKVWVIGLILTLCLATVGASYASWTKTLDINGTVDTGQLNVEFLNCAVTDSEQPNVPDGPVDTGSTLVVCLDTTGDGHNDSMEVSMEGGYMCYTATVTFDVHNFGTVPVKVRVVDITETVPGTVEVAVVGIMGVQIEPGQSIPGTLTAHVATNETGSYGFDVYIEAWNWNAP